MAQTMPQPRDDSFQSSRDPRDVASTTDSTRSPSRGRSFTFLRRTSSKDGFVPTRSTSLGRKLVRRRTSREQAQPVDPNPPRIPSMILPYLPSTPSQQDTRQSGYSQQRPLNYSRSTPTAVYQRRDMSNYSGRGVPVPPIPESSPPTTAYRNDQGYDPHARTESMTNRGRFSYASSIAPNHSDSPRRLRRRKDPTPFNVLVIGTKGCGKTSFIEFLRTALSTPFTKRPSTPSPQPSTSRTDTSGLFTSHYLETELEGERIGLTLYDSKGLERHLVDIQRRDLSSFLETKFSETFGEEQKVMRATGVRDTHVHCVFLILDPARLDANIAASKGHDTADPRVKLVGGLDEKMDIEILQGLEGKTTVIPVISKADTITTAHMAHLKRTVWDSLRKIKFDPLEALGLDDEEEEDDSSVVVDDSENSDPNGATFFEDSSESASRLSDSSPQTEAGSPLNIKKTNGHLAPPKSSNAQPLDVRFSAMSMNVDLPDLPMSIISPDSYDPGVIGRRFPWGFADPYNAEHCDFVRLKETVFSEWRSDLRRVSREQWYEGWRTNRLNTRTSTAPGFSSSASSGMSGPGFSGGVPLRTTSHSPSSAGQPNGSRSTITPQQHPLSPKSQLRAVSGAAAYGTIGDKNGMVPPPPAPRAVSTSEIGVAIGGPESPTEYRGTNTSGYAR